jgi:hypothetical protein
VHISREEFDLSVDALFSTSTLTSSLFVPFLVVLDSGRSSPMRIYSEEFNFTGILQQLPLMLPCLIFRFFSFSFLSSLSFYTVLVPERD